jgi:hypothetical protein
MLWLTLSCSVGKTALPTNVLGRKQDRGPSPRRPPTLTTDILDGLAVAFCIVLFVWAMQHIVFDDLANPIPSARLTPT